MFFSFVTCFISLLFVFVRSFVHKFFSSFIQPVYAICRSVCLSVCLPVCLSVCLSVCLPVCLSVCLSVCLPVCLSVCLSTCLSVCLSVCLSACCLPAVCVSRFFRSFFFIPFIITVKLFASRNFVFENNSLIFDGVLEALSWSEYDIAPDTRLQIEVIILWCITLQVFVLSYISKFFIVTTALT